MIEITDEMIDRHATVHAEAYRASGGDSVAAQRAALEAVAEMIDEQHVQPIEDALAASETQVAGLGRDLHAALARITELRDGSDAHADRLSNGAYER